MKDISGDDLDAVFDAAAKLFAVLSTPIRLRILNSLCHGEKNVSQLLAEIDTTQPNMSQHLATLYRAGRSLKSMPAALRRVHEDARRPEAASRSAARPGLAWRPGRRGPTASLRRGP